MVAAYKSSGARSRTAQAGRRETSAKSTAGQKSSQGASWSSTNLSSGFSLHGGEIQPKVTIGKSDDRYEREADQMADRVTDGGSAGAISRVPPGGLGDAQKKEDAEPEEVQKKSAEAPEDHKVQKAEISKEEPNAVRRQEGEEGAGAEGGDGGEAGAESAQGEGGPQAEGAEEGAQEGGGEEAGGQTEAGGEGGSEGAAEGESGGAAPSAEGAGATEGEGGHGESHEAEGESGEARGGAEAAREESEGDASGEPAHEGDQEGSEGASEPVQSKKEDHQPEPDAKPHGGDARKDVQKKEESAEDVQTKCDCPREERAQRKSDDQPEDSVQKKSEHREEEKVRRKTEPRQPQDKENVRRKGEAHDSQEHVQREASEENGVQSKAAHSGRSRGSMAAAATHAIATVGAGSPLPGAIRAQLEPRFGVDFGAVRLHTDSRAQQAAHDLNAKAFTHRNNIWFGRGQGPYNLKLLAHELTHVVQQGYAKPLVQGEARPHANHQMGAQSEAAPSAPARHKPPQAATELPSPASRALPVRPGTAPASVQRVSLFGFAKRVGSAFVSGVRAVGRAAGRVAEGAMELTQDALLAVVRQVAPDFAELIERDGIMGFLKKAVQKGIDAVFDGVLGRIRSMVNFSAIAAKIKGGVSDISALLGQLARNDCSGLSRVARRVMKFFSRTFGPVIRKVRSIAGKVKGFVNGIVEAIGAPVFEFLSKVGGAVWNGIKAFIRKVGDVFSAIKKAIGGAWTRVKGWFGITADEGSGEGGGLWNWIKEKAATAWSAVSEAVGKISGPLRTVGLVLVALSPAGPVLAVIHFWPQLKRAFQWVAQKWRDMNIIVRARNYLNNTLLPMLHSALSSVSGALQQAGEWLGETTTQIETGLTAAENALAGSTILAPLRSLVGFLARSFKSLTTGVGNALRGATSRLRSVFVRAQQVIRPVWEAIKKIIAIAVNPFGIPGFLLGSIWKMLPDCIKGPLINFILRILIKFLKALPPFIPPLSLLWPVIRQGMLGFLRRMLSFSIERKVRVSNKMANIISGGSVGFAFGFLKGLALGLWDGIIGPFRGIAEMFDLPARIRNFANALGARFRNLLSEAKRIIDWANAHAGDTLDSLINSARDLISHPSKIIDMIRHGIEAAMSAVNRAGGMIASEMMRIFEQPDEKLGEQLGTLTGSSLVNVLLSYFTAGTAGAATIIGRVAGVLARIGRYLRPVIRAVVQFLPRVVSVVRKVASIFARARSAASRFLQKIVGFFRKVVNALRRILGRAGRAIRRGARNLRRRFLRSRLGRRMRQRFRKPLKAWLKFIRTVRQRTRPYQQQGIAKQSLRQIVNEAKGANAIGVLFALVMGRRVHWTVNAAPKVPPPLAFPKRIKVLMDHDARWKAGKKAVKKVLKRMPDSQVSVSGITSALAPVRREFHYSDLHAQWDERENDFDIIGAQSPSGKVAEKKPPLPETNVTYSARNGAPSKMVADPLTKKGPHGSRPSGDCVWWDRVGPIRVPSGRSSLYIQGHLLNHNVHGPGTRQNLTPLTRAANAGMAVGGEAEVKARVTKREVLKYEVSVSYPASALVPNKTRLLPGKTKRQTVMEEGMLARSVSMKAWKKEYSGGKWVDKAQVVNQSVPNVPPWPAGQ